MGLVHTRLKSTLMLWVYFSAGGPGLLIQRHGIMDSIKYQQIKNPNLTPSARNLIILSWEKEVAKSI